MVDKKIFYKIIYKFWTKIRSLKTIFSSPIHKVSVPQSVHNKLFQMGVTRSAKKWVTKWVTRSEHQKVGKNRFPAKCHFQFLTYMLELEQQNWVV